MLPSDDILTEVTKTVFETMLGLAVEGPLDAPALASGHQVAIDITGQWNGALVLTVPETLATLIAAALLGGAADTLTSDDVLDAMSELANMIGGNVKSIIPGPNELSLPRRQLGQRHADGSHSLSFQSSGLPFALHVVRAQADAA